VYLSSATKQKSAWVPAEWNRKCPAIANIRTLAVIVAADIPATQKDMRIKNRIT
jgi:hypothetical protein